MGYESRLIVFEPVDVTFPRLIVIIGKNEMGIAPKAYNLWQRRDGQRGKFFYPNDEGSKDSNDTTVIRVTDAQLRRWRTRGKISYEIVKSIYMRVICEIDLSCANTTYMSDIIHRAHHSKDKKTPCLFGYESNGNDIFVKDSYGEPMYPIAIKDILEAMERDHAKEPYRRFAVAIAMLRVFIDEKMFPKVQCTLYGH